VGLRIESGCWLVLLELSKCAFCLSEGDFLIEIVALFLAGCVETKGDSIDVGFLWICKGAGVQGGSVVVIARVEDMCTGCFLP